MKNKIFLWPKTQYENYGDLVINKILIDELRKHGHLHVSSKDIPLEFFKGLDVKENEKISVSGLKLVVRMIYLSLFKKENIYFFTKPGDWYQNDNIKSILNLTLQTLVYALLFLSGVKICKFGGSIGKFGKITGKLESIKHEFYFLDMLRDSNSFISAKKLGFNNISQSTDLAFILECVENNRKHEDRNCLGYSFRKFTISSQNCKTKKIVSDLKEEYSLEPFYQVTRDLEFISEICNDETVSNVEEISYYQKYDVVVSNRLHVLLFAMSQGAIPIPVLSNDNNKIRYIFKDMGFEDFVYDIDSEVHIQEHIKWVLSRESTLFSEFRANGVKASKDIAKLFDIGDL